MAIKFPGEIFPPTKPDLGLIESYDNAVVGGVEKFSSVDTAVVSLADVVAKTGDTMSGTLNISVPTINDKGLVVRTTDDNASNDLIDYQQSDTTSVFKMSGDGKIGVFGATPVAQSSAYTPSNVSTDRSYDANSTTTDELADVLGTLIADLQSLGVLG